MHSHTKAALTVSFLLISFGMLAQETDHRNDSALLAKLSYARSGVVVQADGAAHVCGAHARWRVSRGAIRGIRADAAAARENVEGAVTAIDSAVGGCRIPGAFWRSLGADSAGRGEF